MTENLAENIDKDNLVTLLKEKGKEIKVLESKNKKLEERYIKIFRENKNYVKDRETLEKVLLTIFDRDQTHFQNKEVGTYDASPLIELWNQRQEEKLMLFNETLENCKVEKTELLGKISQLEKQLEQAEDQNNPDLGKLEERYQKANEKLAQEIKEFEQMIEEKDQEISRLQKAEQEVEGLKAELLFKDLMLKTNGEDKDLKAKMMENDRKNELLRLKHELEEAQEKARQLEEDLKTVKSQEKKVAEMTTQEVQTDGINLQEIMNPSITDLFENSPIHNENVRRASFRTSDSGGETATHLSDSGLVNQEYLKNVIVKLFCYIEGNNAKEVRTLMHAISVILKMTPEDKEKIEDAKKGNNNIWSGAVSFIKDHFGGAKGEVNYATGNHIERRSSVVQ